MVHTIISLLNSSILRTSILGVYLQLTKPFPLRGPLAFWLSRRPDSSAAFAGPADRHTAEAVRRHAGLRSRSGPDFDRIGLLPVAVPRPVSALDPADRQFPLLSFFCAPDLGRAGYPVPRRDPKLRLIGLSFHCIDGVVRVGGNRAARAF